MEKGKIVITYKNSDLDCLASAYAYSEYLNKTGYQASYYVSGQVQKEVSIVCELFNISLDNSKKEILDEDLIMVDTNSFSSVDYINPLNVIEIIDHHPNTDDIKYFKNAELKLYDIGAICTVIAEKFKEDKIEISRESAILLYYGIISNTVNLKSKVTTEKDIEILNWLKSQCGEINDKLIAKIFEEKSKVDINDLRRFLEIEEKFILDSDDMIIGQLEMANALDFVNKYRNNINKIIGEVYSDYNVKYVFINFVDILNGYHLLYANDNLTTKFLENKFNCAFENGIYKEDSVMLRKEVKKYLKSLS